MSDDPCEVGALARNGVATWVVLCFVVGGSLTVGIYDFLDDRERALTTDALVSVPSFVPREPYAPSDKPGQDFDTGGSTPVS